MLLGPALSRDGFAGAAQNTRHRGGGLVALVEKEQGGGQTRTGTDDLPTGNLDETSENSSGKHEGRSTRRVLCRRP